MLKASRAAAPTGIGTFAALAASTISVRSLCARSMVNPGSMSPFSTFDSARAISKRVIDALGALGRG